MKNNNTQPRAVILNTIDTAAKEQLEREGYTTTAFKESIEPNNLLDMCNNADILGIRSGPQLNDDFMRKIGHEMAIGCFCIGTDQVALETAAKEGLVIFNAPVENGRSVAELVMGQTINLLRRLPEHNTRLHNGEWAKSATHSFELRNKTMGIIGYGNIGKQVGVLAGAFGMRVLYHDIVDQSQPSNAEPVDLQTLLEESDIITLHTPGGQLRPIIGPSELTHIKPGSYLINAARADAVDYDALVQYLENGHLAGIAVDVFPDEPRAKIAPFLSKLANIPQAILTPHIGGSTTEAQAAIAKSVTSKLVRYHREGTTSGAVNFPHITLPYPPNTLRLTYTHRNQPGAAAEVSQLIANHGNITASSLATKNEIGYGVYDIEDIQNHEELLLGVHSLASCIRARLIS